MDTIRNLRAERDQLQHNARLHLDQQLDQIGAADLAARVHELKQVNAKLEALRSVKTAAVDASAPTGWPDVLRIVELMQGLNSTSAARRQQAVLARPGSVPVPAELLAGAVLAESDPNVAGALRCPGRVRQAAARGRRPLLQRCREDCRPHRRDR